MVVTRHDLRVEGLLQLLQIDHHARHRVGALAPERHLQPVVVGVCGAPEEAFVFLLI